MAPAYCSWPRRRRGRRRRRLDGRPYLPPPASAVIQLILPLLVLLLLPSTAEARDWYSEALAVRRVGRDGSRIYAQASFDFLWALEPGQLCPSPTPNDDDEDATICDAEPTTMPCAQGLFPPALSALMHAHGVQELSLSLANGRWERDLWGDPTFPPSSDNDAPAGSSNSPPQQHHTEPPYGAEVWARLLLPTAAAGGDLAEGHWRQLLEGLGTLYHSPLGLAAASTAGEGTDGIEAANVIGGGGGGRLLLDPPIAGAFRLSLPASVPGGRGYHLQASANSTTTTQQLRLAHLPAPAGLCTDTLLRTLLGHGPSLLSPCRGGGLGALLAVGLEGAGGPLRLLTGDYLAYALELRRVCLNHEEGEEARQNSSTSSCHRPALAMRQTVRTVLPGASSLILALQGSSSSNSNAATAPSWSLRPCASDGPPSPHHAFPPAPTLRYGNGGLLAGLDYSSGGFQAQALQEEERDKHHPARWVTVGRSKGQPGADVTRGVLRLWLRNDHPSSSFLAEVLETLPFFLAPRVRALAATTTNPHQHNQSIPLRPRFRRGEGKDPATLEYGLELPPASLVQVALPFRTRFLHFEDFPPNPSRGLDVPPAVIGLRRSLSSNGDAAGETARLTTEGLLIDVPLPDFSMPFNVITLVSTLLAFFFGSMLNVVVRKGRRREAEEGKGKGGLRDRLKGLMGRFRRRGGEENESNG